MTAVRSPGIVVGIDAGGTSTRAKASSAGRVVHEGRGGPGNPRTVASHALHANYESALRGCPPPERIIACVAGAGGQVMQDRVRHVLNDLFPRTQVTVTPDYVAAYHALADSADVCVIAGTGSVVCSPTPDGSWAVSGGHGWILGDHGSAARLGQAILELYVQDPAALPPSVGTGIRELVGGDDWHAVVAAVHNSQAPAAVLAAAAPLLTGLSDNADERAVDLVRDQMARLARMVKRHADNHCAVAGTDQITLGLVGGVWKSPSARSLFADALRQTDPRIVVDPARSSPDPLDGALRLAQRAERTR